MMWEVGSGDCLITKAELRAVLLRPATVTPRGAMQPVTVGPLLKLLRPAGHTPFGCWVADHEALALLGEPLRCELLGRDGIDGLGTCCFVRGHIQVSWPYCLCLAAGLHTRWWHDGLCQVDHDFARCGHMLNECHRALTMGCLTL